VNGP